MRKKLLYKILSLIIALIVGFSPLFTLAPSYIYAEDSPEEIVRQEQEAQREAQRRADRQADEQARQAAEAAHEAIEDITPTPTLPPQPTPTIDPNPMVTGTQEAVSGNQDTGANSTNDANSNTDSNTSVDNSNSGELNNNVETNANTGNNTISGDSAPSTTPTPTTTTDNSNPLPECEDNLNSSENVGGEENNFTQEATDVVQNTSSEATTNSEDSSAGDASSQDNDTVTVTNANCASIKNDQDVSSTSGNNDASDNEGSKLNTGDTSSDSSLINEGNKNTTLGDQQSEATNLDDQGSSTDTNSESSEKVSVDNDNQIYAENDVNVESTSGGNTVNNNDGQVTLSTGDVDMIVTLLNILNVNITGEDFTHLIVNIFGDLTGDVDLDKIAKQLGMSEEELQAIARNEETEAQKNNDIRNSKNTELDVNNNNEATVKNNVDVKGTSGENEASGNEDRTKIVTGRIKILVALINFINTNYSGTEWYFAMVNIFGNLKGDLILPDPNGFLVEDTQAVNSQTGEGSNNDATATNNQDATVTNTNQATVNNNVKATGDSGSNNAYNNEDRVSQDSGDVNVVTNLTNWLNINIFGNNWVLLVINVFGKWYGRIVGFPGKGDLEAPESGMLMVAAGGSSGGGPAVTNSNTDPNSNNDTTSNNSQNLNVDNTNNASVENNVNIEGVSGRNTTNNNDDPISVSTGWIDISADLLNIVNMNIVGKRWMLVIVNIFGDFMGDITFPGVKKALLPEFTATAQDSNNQENNSGNQIGSVSESSTTGNNITPTITITITPTPSVKIELLTQGNSNESVNDEKVVEIYKAENKTIDTDPNKNPKDDTVKILGVSVNAGREMQQILFLFALISYLIALRFWAFKKSS